MSKVIVKIVNNCLECEYSKRYHTPSVKVRSYRCEKINPSKLIGEFVGIPINDCSSIPDWCPLEEYSPKFEDV